MLRRLLDLRPPAPLVGPPEGPRRGDARRRSGSPARDVAVAGSVAGRGAAVRGSAPRDAVRRRAHRVLRGRVDHGRRPDLAHRSSAARPRDRRSGRGGRVPPDGGLGGPRPGSVCGAPGRRRSSRTWSAATVPRRRSTSPGPRPRLGSTLASGWSVILFSVAIAAVAALVFARRPDVPAATALMLVAAGAAGSSVPWFLGTTTSDLVLGGPFAVPRVPDRGPVHAHVAGCRPPRARVPGAAARRWHVARG